jgi:Na+-translocating ferredoxin:NAD+ oxidoreductase subunit C
MMGFDLMDLAAPVTKAVNCLIVKNPTLFPPKPIELPCIRCGECARACPADLQPFEMYWYSRAKNFGHAQSYNLFDCIECGCCSYVCPSHIPLVDYFRFAKSEIWEREREKRALIRPASGMNSRPSGWNGRSARRPRSSPKRRKRARPPRQARCGATPADPDAEKKKAILQAALERAQKAKEAVAPKNTENLPPRVQKEIDEIEARRAARSNATTEYWRMPVSGKRMIGSARPTPSAAIPPRRSCSR